MSHVRDLRAAKGLTQDQLAIMVGVTSKTVREWEAGVVPRQRLLKLLARRLGVDPAELFEVDA